MTRMAVGSLGLVGMFLTQGFAAEPRLPTPAEALGSLSNLAPSQRAAFEPDTAFFSAIPAPGAGDWLSMHKEPGQTVAEYRATLSQVMPPTRQRVLCLLPLGDFDAGAPSLERLRKYGAAFFGMEMRLLPAVPLDQVPAKQRINGGTGKKQLLTTDILRWLPAQKPADCYALLAVTMTDLYPEDSWNFVFGQALLRGGAGVFSFARYDPTFFGEPAAADSEALAFERSAKVLTHEMGHMFGLRHCVYFRCLMNGSNSMRETDGCPLHLCPVCLRKLQMSALFDPELRYQSLLRSYTEFEMTAEADWTRRMLEKICATAK